MTRPVALITGGAGFVGSHLTRALVQEGRPVVLLDLLRPSDDLLALPGVTFVEGDVREELHLPGVRADVVYNLAAVHRTPGHPHDEYYATNVAGAFNVTRWCDAQDVKRIVFTSSISVYGASEDLKSEATPPTPNTSYGYSKLFAEEVHQNWQARDLARQLVIVRPAVIFGAGERGNFTRLASALRRRRFAYPGRTDTVKACGYVKDLVRALLFLEDRGETCVRNFCYPTPATIKDVCEAFHDVAGFARPRTVPSGTMGTAQRALGAIGPGQVLAARIGKLTLSTNIDAKQLEQDGFTWSTDLRSALADWAVESDNAFR